MIEGVQPLVEDISQHLKHSTVGFKSHMAIAGGYLRDLASRRKPKDLDFFFDGNDLNDMAHAAAIGKRICALLEDGAEVTQTFASYGGWALDVECVVRIALPQPTHYCNALIPPNIDLVFLRPGQLSKFGFDGSEATFLTALCKRVDLRLNAIGCSPEHTYLDPHWEEDHAEKRLVVQCARIQPNTASDVKRITKRLERLSETKFKGYSIEYELHDGSLTHRPPEEFTIIR